MGVVTSDKPLNYTELDEKDLVQYAKIDPDAFGEIYNRYIKRIFNYIYYRTGNTHDAEDLTSRVFQRALKHIPRYVDKGVPFSAWLYRIAHNLVVNWHRDRSRRTIIPLEDTILHAFASQAPEAVTERREAAEILMEAISRLPDDRQQLIYLKYIEKLPNASIGEIMDRSEGAIKSLYHRTLIALRDEINRIRQDEDSSNHQ